MNVMMHPPEVAALEASVTSLHDDNAQLVEFGCGGSTIFIAKLLRAEQHLMSVEHNQKWYDDVQAELEREQLLDRVTFHFVPLPHAKFGIQTEEEILPDSEAYFNPPVDWTAVRWVFVDGIMRGPVIESLRTRLNPGTPVYLHDYVGRESWYDKSLVLFDKQNPVKTLLPMSVRPHEWLPQAHRRR